jgi:hypothetical protein
VSGQLHAQAALPPGKDPPVPLDKRLSGLQNRSERDGKESKILGSSGSRTLVDQPVTIPTELPRLTVLHV